ncbi:Restriction endonuclease type II-like,DNA polymerase beta-like, N-terminal domain,ERCC4 domain [Cinara cedri]|uniref:Crossover junction endonuclease MUS81 n=1 Tax=Cinara cedri TaxID=506608 RepID=A0A5E4MYV7_9HEMI|nr:Restriction endonuclease type II-like,DNA polymerase beta-like, N-terminal domain,ERCC4 domain [Cinara cedri]
MTERTTTKSKSRKIPKANPLFEQWISEWLKEATEKNLEVRHGYRRALTSLQKCPLPLKSGKECLILKFFGLKLCNKIDKKLEEHNKLSPAIDGSIVNDTSKRKKNVANILQPSTSTSSSAYKPDSIISMDHEDVAVTRHNSNQNPSAAEKENIILWPNEFTVILLIDTGESSSLRKTNMDKVTSELSSLNVNFEMRRLSVGDFAWICRDKTGKELMLPYILERKRLDDLSGSITDGRFHEQKFRLKQCGLDNKIYLVEHEKKYHGLPISNLQQALANTEVIDGFTIVRTENHLESMKYIANFSYLLSNMYKNKILTTHSDDDSDYGNCSNYVKLIPFKTFSAGSAKNKNMTVRDMLIRQLLQVRGLSVHKAFAIVEQYPSPRSLIHAFQRSKNPLLLANITYGIPVKTIGSAISKTLFQIYSN